MKGPIDLDALPPLGRLAQERGLRHLAEALHEAVPPASFAVPSHAPPDDSLVPVDAPEQLFAQLARRGFARDLVPRVRERFAGRPLERGLLAWDILNGTVMAPADEPLRRELLEEVARVRPILPPAGQKGISTARVTSQLLCAELAARELASADVGALAEGVTGHVLGAFEELRRRGNAEHLAPERLARTQAFAQKLQHAHCETLASFYFHYLWTAYGWQPALDDLSEALLDCGAVDRLPKNLDAFALDPDLPTYVATRAATIGGRAAAFYDEKILSVRKSMKLFHIEDQKLAQTSPRTRIAEVELCGGDHEVPFFDSVVDLIVEARPEWRYGARIRAWKHARRNDARAQPLLEDYLRRFGSDGDLFWLVEDGTAEWMIQLIARAAREAVELPHHAGAWAGLMRLVLDDALAQAALNVRLVAQCTLPNSDLVE
jgi:hypothetical protein